MALLFGASLVLVFFFPSAREPVWLRYMSVRFYFASETNEQAVDLYGKDFLLFLLCAADVQLSLARVASLAVGYSDNMLETRD